MKTDSMTIDNKELNNVEATKEQTGQTSDTWQAYTKKTHVIGRTVSIITLVMLVGAPFLIGKLLGAYPDLGAVGKGFLSVGIVWLVPNYRDYRFNARNTDGCHAADTLSAVCEKI